MEVEIGELIDKTIIYISGHEIGSLQINFACSDGSEYALYHSQDCCEHVRIEDISGDITDLIGSPITLAEEISSEGHPAPENPDSYTWTFYRLATAKGYVTIRWLGESNGYYSESVSFVKLNP